MDAAPVPTKRWARLEYERLVDRAVLRKAQPQAERRHGLTNTNVVHGYLENVTNLHLTELESTFLKEMLV
jgi:hypothetical protein